MATKGIYQGIEKNVIGWLEIQVRLERITNLTTEKIKINLSNRRQVNL